MIKNIIFDVGNVMVLEKGATIFPNLSIDQQKELNDLVYFKSEGFIDTLLGHQTTAEYRQKLLETTSKYHEEINILLSLEGMPIALPKVPEMVGLAYKLKADGYKIYFLSDMVDVTFDYLHDFLKDFDGGAYSYQEHLKKPNEKFFRVLIERYKLAPAESIFFDDKQHNVDAAQKLSMQAVTFTGIDSVLNVLEK